MDTASKILIVARHGQSARWGTVGIPMAFERQGGAEAVSKYPTMVHLGGLMNGPILIWVAFVLTTSTLTPWVDTTSAVLLAVASGLLVAKDTINWSWLRRTGQSWGRRSRR